MIYLDHNATSPLLPGAREAVLSVLDLTGNASSVHRPGRKARSVIEGAREHVARLVGAHAGSVTFTSGGTEANALALKGAVAGALEEENRITRILISAVEHESVRANSAFLAETVAGVKLSTIAVNADGVVDVAAFRLQLMQGKGRPLVSLMAANNETGVLQPVREIADILRREAGEDALLHVDAAQMPGRLPLSFIDTTADYMSLSAHKFGGPQGGGALIVKDGAPLAALLAGTQEKGRRGGTENVAAITGFGAAAAETLLNDAATVYLRDLRDRFETGLKAFAPDAVIFGAGSERLPNTSNFALPGIPAETALIALDLDGVALSSGSACSSGKVRASHVLSAMGISDDLARCGLRLSLGITNSKDDIAGALSALQRLYARKSGFGAAA